MRRSIPLFALLACLLALAAAPAAVHANATDNRIAAACEASDVEALNRDYSKTQLRHALRNLPSDVLEYSGCWDALRQALRAPAGGGAGGDGDGGAAGSGGSAAGGGFGGTGGGDAAGGAAGDGAGAPTPPSHTGTETPVAIAGTPVEPGELPSIGHDANALPDSLVALLVLLGLAALVPAALTIGRRVIARRGA
jgi:hypothetical protein